MQECDASGLGIIGETVLNHYGVVELGSFNALVEVGSGSAMGLAVARFKSCNSGFQQLANHTGHPGFLVGEGGEGFVFFGCDSNFAEVDIG